MNDDDDKTAVVIPWPHPKAPSATPQPGGDDAFDAAVRRALEAHAAGEAPPTDADPRSAEALVAQVYSALSGTEAEAGLAAVREHAAAAGAPVIDLQAVREARLKAVSEPNLRLGAALAETFQAFMKSIAAREGKSEVVLDGNFFKQHGATLLGNLFKGLASTLTQGVQPPTDERSGMSSGAPQQPSPTERERVDESAPADAPTPQSTAHEVRIRVDLGSLLSGLFKRRGPTSSEPERTEPPDAGAPKPDET